MRRHLGLRVLAAFALILLAISFAAPAHALINPDFTPVQLVRQSESILLLTFGPKTDRGDIELTVQRALTGVAPEKPPVLNLRNADAQLAATLRTLAAADGHRTALLFVSKPPAGATNRVGLLHLGTTWYRLAAVTPRVWQIERVDATLQATWAGSSDMLARAADYVLANPDAVIPAKIESAWMPPIQLTQLRGDVRGLQKLRLANAEPPCLLAQSSAGDRLFQWSAPAKNFRDVTATWNLQSHAQLAVCADFDRDSRLDLATWNGKQLELWLQRQAGRFDRHDVDYDLNAGCDGLEIGPTGQLLVFKGLACTRLSFEFDARGNMSVKPLPVEEQTPEPDNAATAAETSAINLTGHGNTLAIDLQGHGKPTLLQRRGPGHSFVWRPADDLSATAPNLAGVQGDGVLCAADFDGDGQLDLLLAGKQGCRLWTNQGDGKFADHTAETGELHALAKSNANACCVCDVNGDGRPDVAIGYSDRGPQIFFNRGFRCFGLATSLSLDDSSLLAEHGRGTRAIALGDLRDDGLTDLALVALDGTLVVLPQKVPAASPPLLKLQIGAAGLASGATRVLLKSASRPHTAWYLRPGGELLVGADDPGQLKLEWQFAGQRLQQKTLICEPGQLRFDIRPPRTEPTDALPP